MHIETPDRVTCRVDPRTKSITVIRGDIEHRTFEQYRSVSGKNAVFGNGLIQIDLEETWKWSAFDRAPRGFRRAYYNPNKYTRYVDRETKKPVTESRAVVLDCASVYYLD